MVMKSVRLIEQGSALEMRELEIPAVGPGEVLVRVGAAGICHGLKSSVNVIHTCVTRWQYREASRSKGCQLRGGVK